MKTLYMIRSVRELITKRALLFLTLALILIPGLLKADPVSDWNAIAAKVFYKVAKPAGNLTIDMAYMHIAIYDAVNSIDRRYSVFAVEPTNSIPWASKEAAAISAAYRVLVTFYPSQQSFLDSAYEASLSAISSGGIKTIGIAIGEEVARKFLKSREGDGRNADVPYTFGSGPGVYQLTPGAPAPPATPASPWLAHMKPFSLDSTSQFRAPAPPTLISLIYTRDFNETKQYGALKNSLRTAQMDETGLFYTENPGLQFARNIRLFASEQNFTIADNARFFAQLYVTISDALISAWESKFYYNRWRPVTAIRQAETDNNSFTDQDTSWLPMVVTPNYPGYPAAHGAGTGSLAYALERFFGNSKVNITLTSTTVPGADMTKHSFTDINDIVTEVINARVYCGMTFRTSVEAGAGIAFRVADFVADHKFKPVATTVSQIPAEGLQLWLRADTGIVLNGSTVSRWLDQSGNGNDAAEVAAQRQPVVVNDVLNHKPVIRFDGINDRLGFTGSKLMSQMSLFIVFKNDSGAAGPNPNFVYIFRNSRNTDAELGMSVGGLNNLRDRIGIGGDQDHLIEAISPGLGEYNQWRNISIVTDKTIWNTTVRWNSKDATMKKIGSDIAISTPMGNAEATGGGLGQTDGFGLIDGKLARSFTFKGDVAELIIYDTVVSDSIRHAIDTYLTVKYNLGIATDVKEVKSVPERFSLEQNYPNPFNPTTTISFTIPSPGFVSLKVYDLLGKEVATLLNEEKAAGNYNVEFKAANLSSGIYFYILKEGKYIQTKKLLLMK